MQQTTNQLKPLFVKPSEPFTFPDISEKISTSPFDEADLDKYAVKVEDLTQSQDEESAENIDNIVTEEITEDATSEIVEAVEEPVAQSEEVVSSEEPVVTSHVVETTEDNDEKLDDIKPAVMPNITEDDPYRDLKDDLAINADNEHVKFCKPFHIKLDEFLKSCVYDTNIPETNIEIDTISIARGRNCGLWDEGGKYGQVGRALTVAASDGSKMTPTSVFHHLSIVNGRHALIPIWSGCFVIFAGKKDDSATIAVYRLNTVSTSRQFMRNHHVAPSERGDRYSASLCVALRVHYNSQNEMDGDTVLFSEPQFDTYRSNLIAPMLAALAQCDHEYSVTPAYVTNYRTQHVDKKICIDFDSCIDACSTRSIIQYDTLNDAYNAMHEISSRLVGNIANARQYKTYHSFVYIYTYIDNKTQKVNVLLAVVKFNIITGSSDEEHNRLWFGRVVLGDNDKFWIPEQNQRYAKSASELYKQLVSQQYRSNALTVLRRMTLDNNSNN